LALVASVTTFASSAGAVLTVTGYGQSQQYSVEAFVTGLPNAGRIGPVGVTPARPNVNGVPVWIADYGNGTLYQVFDSPSPLATFNPSIQVTYGANNLNGLAMMYLSSDMAYHYYMAQQASNRVIEFDGTTGAMLRIASGSVPAATGIVPYPACVASGVPPLGGPHCNHLFVTADSGPPGATAVFEVDPVTAVTTPFVQVSFPPDGLAWDPTGTTLYVVDRANVGGPGTILTFDGSGSEIPNDIPMFGGGPDGIAVGLGSLQGCLYANANDGNVYEIKLSGTSNCTGNVNNPTTTVLAIAAGGSRGDLVAVDTYERFGNANGTFPSLFVTQTDSVYRIDPPFGGWFGPPTSSIQPPGPPATVPAIPSWGMPLLSLLMLACGILLARKCRPSTSHGRHRLRFTRLSAGFWARHAGELPAQVAR
jgi:hypothetical protein